jgi:hypothetical protein
MYSEPSPEAKILVNGLLPGECVIHYPPVSQQKGSNDCGLYAIAFAASLCANEDPSGVCYIQNRMRGHL